MLLQPGGGIIGSSHGIGSGRDDGINAADGSGRGSYQHSRVGGGNGGVRNEDLGFVVTRGTAPGRGGYSSVQMT